MFSPDLTSRSSPGVGQGHCGRVCALQKCGWHPETLLCATLGRGEFRLEGAGAADTQSVHYSTQFS